MAELVDCVRLEIWSTCKGTVGSNPTFSAKILGHQPKIFFWKIGRVVMQRFAKPYISKRMRGFESLIFRKKRTELFDSVFFIYYLCIK